MITDDKKIRIHNNKTQCLRLPVRGWKIGGKNIFTHLLLFNLFRQQSIEEEFSSALHHRTTYRDGQPITVTFIPVINETEELTYPCMSGLPAARNVLHAVR